MLIVLISQYSVMGVPTKGTELSKSCPTGFEWVDDQCTPMKSESTTSPTVTAAIPSDSTVTPPNKPTESAFESTTASNEPNLSLCPKGTRRDNDGSCQEINPSKPAKTTYDPTESLGKNGSCPPGFKRFEKQCLFVESTTKSTSASDNLFPARFRAFHDENSAVKLIPVGPHNVCPPGTEHADFGLCQETRPSTNGGNETENPCPYGVKRINGKCADASNTQTTSDPSKSTTMSPVEPTTRPEKFVDNEKPFTTTRLPSTTDIPA
jgi:hypothetical protein